MIGEIQDGYIKAPLPTTLVPSVTSTLKQISSSYYPWDLLRYGDAHPDVHIFRAFSADRAPGLCLPAEHASGGPQTSSAGRVLATGAFMDRKPHCTVGDRLRRHRRLSATDTRCPFHDANAVVYLDRVRHCCCADRYVAECRTMSMRRRSLDPPCNGLSRGDHIRLRGVVSRIAKTYPPDWLERGGPQLYCATILASLMVTYLVGAVWSPWWTYLIPVVFPLLLSVLLVLLFDREPSRPRWAHPLAIVNDDDAAIIGALLHK